MARILASTLMSSRDVRQNSAVPPATYQSSPPAYVPVKPAAHAVMRRCWFNVREQVSRNGGSALFGWGLWRRHDSHYQAVHHAVWQRDDGSLLDITPPESDAIDRILFMADSRVPYDFENGRYPAALLLLNESTPSNILAAWIGHNDEIFPSFGLLRPKPDGEHGK